MFGILSLEFIYMILLTILAVIVIFSALVLIHEYGHFIAARRAGIKVLEFGIGFPPRLFGKRRGETLYSINAIPFGGFVKLFGEDASDPAILKHKRSFSHQTPWTRTKVVIAGVLMNFFLAIALLTLGFIFGIEPLLVTEQDLFSHLRAGNIAASPGVFIAEVIKKAESSGLLKGDQILAIDDRPVNFPEQLALFNKGKAKKDIDLTVRSKDQVKKIHLPLAGKDFGVALKPYTEFPRTVIFEIKTKSASAASGLQSGDVILKVNGNEVYYPEHVETVLNEAISATFEILRGSQILTFSVDLPDARRVVLADVFAGSAAEIAGFQKGDLVLKINDTPIFEPRQVQEILRNNPGKPMQYTVLRSGHAEEIYAKTRENNLLGIALATVSSFKNSEISFYRGTLLTSIIEIKKVRYGPWKSFKQAISESFRLTGLTVNAFGRTIRQIVSRFEVPAEIGGPVQIAYYTHTFVKEGFFALLRFTALLSLSLAVINILPIPALDGGRLLFIVIEVLFKKRVNARLESLVHSIGFVLLLLLIALVTYSDITKLF